MPTSAGLEQFLGMARAQRPVDDTWWIVDLMRQRGSLDYGGSWPDSWQRRAVRVHAGLQRSAALQGTRDCGAGHRADDQPRPEKEDEDAHAVLPTPGTFADEAAVDVVSPIVDRIGTAVARCARCCLSRDWPKPQHDRSDDSGQRNGWSLQQVHAAADPPGAPSMVTEAVVLNEEMARGVLAARDAQVPPGRRSEASPVLRQLHDALDGLARLYPELQGMAKPTATRVPASGDAALPHVNPQLAMVRSARHGIDDVV